MKTVRAISMSLRTGKTRRIFRGKHLNVWATEFFDKNGRKHTWEWLGKRDAVVVFPITREQKVVLIKNFRVPLQQYVIELPAGLKDKRGESDKKTARRELLEETGYVAKKLIPLPPVPYHSAISRNITKIFVATGLKKKRTKTGDDSEDIIPIEVPLKKLTDFYLHLGAKTLFNIGTLGVYAVVRRMRIAS